MPPFLAFTTVVGPVVSLFNLTADGVLRLLRVQPRDELETAITSDQLADLIAESAARASSTTTARGGSPAPCPRRDATVADVLVPRASWCRCRRSRRVDDVARAVADTGFSRFPVRAAAGDSCSGYLHVKDILDLVDDDRGRGRARRTPPSPPSASAGCPRCASPPGSTHAVAVLRAPAPTSPGPSTRAAPPPGWSPSRTWSRCSSAPCATQRTGRADRPLVGRSALPVVRSADGVVD